MEAAKLICRLLLYLHAFAWLMDGVLWNIRSQKKEMTQLGFNIDLSYSMFDVESEEGALFDFVTSALGTWMFFYGVSFFLIDQFSIASVIHTALPSFYLPILAHFHPVSGKRMIAVVHAVLLVFCAVRATLIMLFIKDERKQKSQ